MLCLVGMKSGKQEGEGGRENIKLGYLVGEKRGRKRN